MINNSISLSQPLHSKAYNEYLSGKMQGSQTVNSSVLGANNHNIVENMGFASELRSQKTVSALMNLPTEKLTPTLQEQGAIIGADGSVTLPQSGNLPTQGIEPDKMTNLEKNLPNNTKISEEAIVGIPLTLNAKPININLGAQGLPLNSKRIFALDGRSLNILSRVAEKTQNLRKEIEASQAETSQVEVSQTGISQIKISQEDVELKIGSLSARYESSNAGSSAIGYDRVGGTSYGTYQIASNPGTFTEFLKFLDEKSPEWAEKLRTAGPANTGSRSGAVPNTWKALVAENPEKMKQLEHEFIVKTHYSPVESYVKENWEGNISTALKEVIFSTAVQHGVQGAKRVFDQAFEATNGQNIKNTANVESKTNADPQAELIKNVYANRVNKFGASTAYIQDAAKQRFIYEQNQALKLLG